MTEPQTLEFIIVHNSNPFSPTPSLLLQTIDSIDIEPSTPFHSNQSQSVNDSEFIVYSWKKKKSKNDIKQQIYPELIREIEPNSIPKETHSSNIDSNPIKLENDELNLPIAKRKGVRSWANHPIYNFISYKSLSLGYQAFVTSLTDIQIANNIEETIQIPEWKTTIQEEIWALEKNGIWELTELPKGKNLVGSKWIFTIKYKANGSLDRYKTWLVAKRFT